MTSAPSKCHLCDADKKEWCGFYQEDIPITNGSKTLCFLLDDGGCGHFRSKHDTKPIQQQSAAPSAFDSVLGKRGKSNTIDIPLYYVSAEEKLNKENNFSLDNFSNTFIDVDHYSYTGMNNIENCSIFVREEMLRNWKLLQKSKNLIFYGQSGTGKTLLCYTYCIKTKIEKPVIWIHSGTAKTSRYISVTRINNNLIERLDFKKSTENLLEFLSNDAENYSLIVLDGLFEESFFAEILCELQVKKVRVIICSSSFSVDSLPQDFKEAKKPSQREILSWSEDEINLLINSISVESKFFNSQLLLAGKDTAYFKNFTYENRFEYYETKKYYSGASARWLFQFSIEDIKDEWNTITQKMAKNCGSHISSADLCNIIPTSHRITSVFKSKDSDENIYYISSKFVVIEFAKFLRLKLKDFFNEINKIPFFNNNPSFQGWLCEYAFQDYLEASLRGKNDIILSDDKRVNYKFKINDFMHAPEGELSPSKKMLPYDWAAPAAFNQALYDFFCIMPVEKKTKLVAIQVTKAVRHDLKIDNLFKLKDALLVKKVPINDLEVWVIHPKNLIGSNFAYPIIISPDKPRFLKTKVKRFFFDYISN